MNTQTQDILLFERGDGGEMSIRNNDLELTESILQQVYLALFGGNIEANTIGNELDSQERFDYWANALFWNEEPNKQFNSNTERTILNTALNTSGRLAILDAVNTDLQYLRNIVNFTAQVNILSTDKVEIRVELSPTNNLQDRILVLVYDNARNEVITQKII